MKGYYEKLQFTNHKHLWYSSNVLFDVLLGPMQSTRRAFQVDCEAINGFMFRPIAELSKNWTEKFSIF